MDEQDGRERGRPAELRGVQVQHCRQLHDGCLDPASQFPGGCFLSDPHPIICRLFSLFFSILILCTVSYKCLKGNLENVLNFFVKYERKNEKTICKINYLQKSVPISVYTNRVYKFLYFSYTICLFQIFTFKENWCEGLKQKTNKLYIIFRQMFN